MARWTDIATWVGATSARNAGGMSNPPRGLVLHIASGFYDGTISWQKRDSGSDRTSSHFIVGRDGRCAQMVDTADASWAQKSGNGTWLSIELEGFAPDDGLHASHPGWETATAAQVEVCARLLARAHAVYGVPLQLATSPSGRGLGHHSMGAESGVDWGHSACPGTAIKNQKPAILARAQQLTDGDDMGAKQDAEVSNANRYGYALVAGLPKIDGIYNPDNLSGPAQTLTNWTVTALQQLTAAAAENKVRDTALAAAVQALAVGSGIDVDGLMAHVEAAVKDAVQPLQAQLAAADARAEKLAAALAAAGGALEAADS
jgi:hypothetical protein